MIEVPLAQPARVTPDRTPPVRPRPAASLILLRASAEGIAVLMGRRVRSARFMPGFYVCPGGRVAGEDSDTWLDELRELGVHHVEFRCDPLARAALRETYEETGVLVGRPGRAVRQATAPTPVEAAYRAADIVPDLAL